MKKSIALLSVIIFMFILFGIISSILSFTTQNSESNYSMIQNSLMIKNIESILKEKTKDIDSIDDLKKLFGVFKLNSPDKTEFKIEITPLNKKINMSYNTNLVSQFLDNLFEFYDVHEPYYLKNIILDSMDKNKDERDSLSEISLYQDFPDGRIINFKELKKILDYYVSKSDDKSVYKIPWKEFIYFSKNNQIIECTLLKENKKLLTLLRFDDLDCNNKIMLKKYEKLGIIPYSKNRDFLLNIKINNNLNLVYSIKNKKVVDIESYPLY